MQFSALVKLSAACVRREKCCRCLNLFSCLPLISAGPRKVFAQSRMGMPQQQCKREMEFEADSPYRTERHYWNMLSGK